MSHIAVIGSGPLGAAAARRLAERGCTVTLLEAGESPPLQSRPGEHLRNQLRFRHDPEAYLIEAIGQCTFYDPAVAPDGLPGACETIAFGGQGVLWTNNCPRAQPHERWDALDDGGWARRYGEAEALLQVTTDQCTGSLRQQRVAARLDEHLAAARVAGRRVERLPLAGRADGSGGIHYTASADILDGCTAPEKLAIRSQARVARLDHTGRHVTAVMIDGERIEADAVIVAAGVFATPRLLYASGIRAAALGRWLHYHPLLLGQVILYERLAAPAGAPDPPPRLWIPPTSAAPWHGMVLRDVGAGAARELAEERRLIELQFFAPVEPRAEHCMTLDGTVPRFSVQLSARDREIMAAMCADVSAIGAALGRWRQGCEPEWNPCGFSHPMGSTRMGDDPASSVVDRRGRVHGFDNLYVAGVSVVPVPIAVNPTLTAVALALETVDSIAAA